MNHLTILYDPGCPLCRRCCNWLSAQPTFFPLAFVAQGTAAAGERYPTLNVGPGRPVDDLIVVADDGGVYRNTRAWVMCFYALRDYRPLAFRLAHPALLPLARRAYTAIAHNRMWLSRTLRLGGRGRRITNETLADRIRTHTAPVDDGCHNAVARTMRGVKP